MKACINSLLAVLLLTGIACNKPQEPVALPEETAPIAIEPQPLQPVVAVANAEKPTQKTQANLSAETLAYQLKNWDKKLATLQTDFIQTTSYDGVDISRSHGKLAYEKATSRLRLDTLSETDLPEQTAITDKQSIIILDDTGRQVAQLAWKEWQQGQPNQALFDFGNYTALLNRHRAELAGPYELALTPKGGETYTLYVQVSAEDFFPTRLKIVSDLMQTQAELTHTQKNKPLATNTFGGFFQ